MTAEVANASADIEELVWWYKDGDERKGPASVIELRRLFDVGLLTPQTPVWREAFGEHWRRLDATDAWARQKQPAADYGRWTKSFAKFEAQPKRWQWSYLGFFLGPFAYFWYGMWRKGLVILAACLLATLAIVLVEDAVGWTASRTPILSLNIILAIVVKRDYYKYRVFGERMWPSLRYADNGVVCGGAVVGLLVALSVAYLANDADALSGDISGVWQSDGSKVVIDILGRDKTIVFDGVSHPVTFESVDRVANIVVFRDLLDSNKPITLKKHFSDDRSEYTVDLFVDDAFKANLTYVRPL